MERYICIHGHFYQPPRENPWLEAVEQQDSAYPFHDWNDRITAECYAPNGVARLLDGEGRIADLINNYAHMSFNFGPTLLSWLEEKAPEVYQSILDADRDSLQRFSGHGSALAQPYNHLILPLANRRDKVTQVLWGIADFEHRFGRKPEGMWLPETAVDLETLEVLAEQGIRFTVLSPYQAARVRKLGATEWQEVLGGHVDPTRTYLQKLPSGRTINLFFYDGPISRAVAFEKLLVKGEYLVDRLLGGFSDQRDWPQLVHIATDGESYGHHHTHGDMGLAYALHTISRNVHGVQLTNYGEYLERCPPQCEVQIVENTAWSCAHGIDRWRADCGCNSGRPGWNQAWRAPLREALDALRDILAHSYEKHARRFFRDPWAARNASIALVLDRRPETIHSWLNHHTLRDLNENETTLVLKLIELQRQTQLMYTSCGWFFDEISGLETVQILQYAGRAIQLGEELFGEELEEGFLRMLEKAPSNLAQYGSGRGVYETFVQSARVGWEQIGAHYAISSLFETYTQQERFFCYTADREKYAAYNAGKAKLLLGRARITSEITRESAVLTFGVLHLGDHQVNCGVERFVDEAAEESLMAEVSDAFQRGDLAQVIRLLDRHFGDATFSLKSLFRDEQRKVLKQVLQTGLAEAENVYRRLHEQHLPTMRFLIDMGAPLPHIFRVTAEFLLNSELRWDFKDAEPNLEHIQTLLREAQVLHVNLDTAGLGYKMKMTISRMAERFRDQPENLAVLQALDEVVQLVASLPFKVDLWRPQNLFYELKQTIFPNVLNRFEEGDRSVESWLKRFISLGWKLGVRVVDLQHRINEALAMPTAADVVREVLAHRRLPRATYRFQFNSDFTFRHAQQLVPYLDELGISDCYASPIFQARPGSRHGYDICNHQRLNPELGTEADFEAFTNALRERNMGLILDVVPNHMGIGHPSNLWWNDVLENGPSSIYARFFDITWNPPNRNLENKVLLPLLEDQYGKVLESGKIRLTYENGTFAAYYYEHRLPISPCSYSQILQEPCERLREKLGNDHPSVRELQSILTALSYLPPQTELAPEKIEERDREKEVIKLRLGRLVAADNEVKHAIDATVLDFNGKIGQPASFDRLDALLDAQAYRPAFWRVATEEINYRRFFDINDLAAIRIEDPQVFQATHALLFRLLAEGKVTGVRIDHPDGLWNPSRYFRQLQEEYVRARIGVAQQTNGGLAIPVEEIAALLDQELTVQESHGGAHWPLYVVAEKILCQDEELPRDWAVAGTTGYDFLNLTTGLFIDSANEAAIDTIHTQFIGRSINYEEFVNSTKKMIMLVSLASEINALSQLLDRISERNRRYRDFTLISLTFVIREIMACLPVYRTYITDPDSISLSDRLFVEEAVEKAKHRNPRTAESIFDFIRDTLLLRDIHDFREEDRPSILEWTMKFQQVSGPVMAKGVEDTALYVYNRLIALNEVGGHPNHFGVSLTEFHKQNLERQRSWPHSQLTSSTHDTKRSEGVRARLTVLSEMPEVWRDHLERWHAMNESKKTLVDGRLAPDSNDECLLYQTLVGVWPAQPLTPQTFPVFRERILEYMKKATKEAKIHTSWVNPNEDYDSAVRTFVMALLPDDPNDPFLKDLLVFQQHLAHFGYFNSLSQTVLKLTCPGVPDFYQGSEIWDFNLVDPDNRRPVDYECRLHLVRTLHVLMKQQEGDLRPLARELLANLSDGRIKLYAIRRILDYRRVHADLFAMGSYQPLEVQGTYREHLCAFMRGHGQEKMIVVVPRLIYRLLDAREIPPIGATIWVETWLTLPEEERGRTYRQLFTGESWTVGERDGVVGLPLATVLGQFPVAVLTSEKLG